MCVYMVCVSGVGRGMRAVYAVCVFGGVCLCACMCELLGFKLIHMWRERLSLKFLSALDSKLRALSNKLKIRAWTANQLIKCSNLPAENNQVVTPSLPYL